MLYNVIKRVVKKEILSNEIVDDEDAYQISVNEIADVKRADDQ